MADTESAAPKAAAKRKPAAKRPAGDGGAAAEARDTKRMVLKRETVIVVPEGVQLTAEAQKAIAAAMKVKTTGGLKGVEGWVVVGEFEGASKDRAIKAHTGEPGTPDAKQGVYRAPSVTAWRGGMVLEAPPAPLVRAKALED